MHSIFTFALSALCATAAVAGPIESRQIFVKPRTPIDATTYAKVSKYPAYSTAPYLMPFIKPCIPPFKSVMTDYINITSTDTQMAIFRNDADKEVIVGIPGLNSSSDIFTAGNFELVPYFSPGVDCFLCHVHGGFLTSWNSINDAVQAALKRQLASHPTYKVIVAGHSLGGALCSLAYASLTGSKLPVEAAYCSGSPRVGDQAYANYIDKLSGASDTKIGNYYRATHYNDGVPQVPPESAGYVHPRTEIFESLYNSTLAGTYHCYGQEPGDCNDVTGQGQGIPNAHETYAGVRYDCMGGYSPGPPNP